MINIDVHKQLSDAEGIMKLHVNVQIEEGSFIALYGPSGTGKTSLLRMLAGLLTPDHGNITIGAETYFNKKDKINLSPQKRSIGLVFQEFALFPHMTVQQNLETAQQKHDAAFINEIIGIMELQNLANRKPSMLSGGQKQRVALARSIVQKPKLLLLDEPLSALDHAMRAKLQEYLKKIHSTFKLTTIMVSHDIGEIYKLADQIIQIKRGKVIQFGTPEEVFGFKVQSGKFKFFGEIISIQKEDIIYVVSVLVNGEIVRVVTNEVEAKSFTIGDRVLIASKAFNPIIKKVST
ncbi:MAG: ABC transporter ATP-binding protein [Bacteroidota bacterium]